MNHKVLKGGDIADSGVLLLALSNSRLSAKANGTEVIRIATTVTFSLTSCRCRSISKT
jgi:hypothetical protein